MVLVMDENSPPMTEQSEWSKAQADESHDSVGSLTVRTSGRKSDNGEQSELGANKVGSSSWTRGT